MLICIIFVCVHFYIMLSFTIHSKFTLCNLLFILLASGDLMMMLMMMLLEEWKMYGLIVL